MVEIPEEPETGLVCPQCPDGRGRLHLEETADDGSTRVSEWICNVCDGQGWITLEQWRTWKLANRLHKEDGE